MNLKLEVANILFDQNRWNFDRYTFSICIVFIFSYCMLEYRPGVQAFNVTGHVRSILLAVEIGKQEKDRIE